MEHLSQDRLIDFADGGLSTEEVEDVYAHLVECDACARRAKALRALRADFDGHWARWLAAMAGGTSPASEIVPSTFEIAARLIVDGTKGIVAMGQKGIADWMGAAGAYGFELRSDYGGVAGDAPSAEAQRLVEEGTERLDAGDAPAARKRLEDAARIDPELLRSVMLVASHVDGATRIEIRAHSARRGVSVLLFGVGTGETGWAALLLKPDRTVVRSAPLQEVPGAAYLLGEFIDLEDDEYMICVEKK